MSSTTTNLGLTKTTAAETIGQTWAASNESGGNFDIIDGKMGAVGDTSLQAQVNALNSKLGEFREFNYPAISGTSDAECVETALANVLTEMSSGSFIARILRTGAWLLVCYGAVRNGIAYAQCFNTANGTIYIFAKSTGQSIVTVKTYS